MKAHETIRPGYILFNENTGTNYEIVDKHIGSDYVVNAWTEEDKSDLLETLLTREEVKRLAGAKSISFVKEYRVEFIERKDAGDHFNFGYNGQWADEIVEASSDDDAIETVKQHLIDNGVDPDYIDDDMLFRTM